MKQEYSNLWAVETVENKKQIFIVVIKVLTEYREIT
jgi:hypothetical protein